MRGLGWMIAIVGIFSGQVTEAKTWFGSTSAGDVTVGNSEDGAQYSQTGCVETLENIALNLPEGVTLKFDANVEARDLLVCGAFELKGKDFAEIALKLAEENGTCLTAKKLDDGKTIEVKFGELRTIYKNDTLSARYSDEADIILHEETERAARVIRPCIREGAVLPSPYDVVLKKKE